MTIEYASYTNIGDCHVNEDTVMIGDRGAVKFFLAADGLGGHGGGSIASAHVASVIEETVNRAVSASRQLLEACFREAQSSLLRLQEEQHAQSGMKTTLVLLITDGEKWFSGHIGDSRLYYYSHGRQKAVTLDHSVPQMMVREGKISPEELRHHPDRSSLLRAMGVPWSDVSYEVDQKGKRLAHGDCFLLCTDGLWEWVSDEEMLAAAVSQAPSEEIVTRLGTLALYHATAVPKKRDNVSAVFLRVR